MNEKRKPMIGVIPSFEQGRYHVKKQYLDAIAHVGGLPFIVPYILDEQDIAAYCAKMDGLLLIGGVDVDPYHYHEEPLPALGEVVPERDAFEMRFTRSFFDRDKPIFAICRGIQLLNVCFGGSLIQDIPSQNMLEGRVQHVQKAPNAHASHHIHVKDGTILQQIVGFHDFRVNSYHHQAVKGVAPDFRVAAVAKDGIIEAIEHKSRPFVIGVQWHPEDQYLQRENLMLFGAFVKAAR